jgi:hypothetical protein
MNTEHAGWGEPQENTKMHDRGMLKFALGAAALAGAALAFSFLIVQGGFFLAVAVLVELLSLIAPTGRDSGGLQPLAAYGSLMIVGGLCLAFGLLDLAFRAIMGESWPGRDSVLRFFLVSAVLLGATAAAVRAFVP